MPEKSIVPAIFVKASFFLLTFILVWWAYLPGAYGPFVFDDFPNIVENSSVHVSVFSFDSFWKAAFSTATGPLARPIPMASFALNFYFGGMNEFYFKASNVVIHCFNGFLVYLLALMVLTENATGKNSHYLKFGALATCLFWCLHPLNLTSVLYVVQRMVELSSMFGLLCVLAYLKGRRGTEFSSVVAWHAVSAIFFVLALFCKENMLILVPLIAWLEWVLFGFSGKYPKYISLMKVAFLLAGVVIVGYVIYEFPSFEKGYEFRPFTMKERLLTQTRVMFFYVGQILVPNIGNMQLFHDEIPISQSLWQPVTTIISMVGLFVLVAAAFFARARAKLISLAIGWFLIGHLVESSFVSLELVHNHRNYFPMIGIAIALGGALAKYAHHNPRLAWCVAGVVSLFLSVSTHLRAADWSSWEVFVVTEAEKNPGSSRSQYEAGRYYYWLVERAGKNNYKKENYDESVRYFEAGTSASETSLASLAALIRLADMVGSPPKKEWKDLMLERIGTRRPDPNDINKVGDVFRCRIDDKCSVDIKFLSEVAAATLANKNLPGFTRGSIASAASALALKEQRGDFAIYYAMQALVASPVTFEFFLNAMKLARICGDRELADTLMKEYLSPFSAPDQKQRIDQEYSILIKELSEHHDANS